MKTIKFNKKEYRIRKIDIVDIGSRIIASTILNKDLFTNVGQYRSDEARQVDEQIYFFVEPDKLELNDIELIAYVNKYCV